MCSVASRANNNLKICRPILCLLSLSVAIIIANRVDSLVALVSRGLVTAKPPTSPKHHYKCIKSLSPLALSSSPFNHTLLAFFLIVSLRCKDEDVKKKKKKKKNFPILILNKHSRDATIERTLFPRQEFPFHRLRKVDDH